jgi:hypothetical protein
MDELVNQVSRKTGLPAETVRPVANEVLNFIKQKLPAPIASQVDGFLGAHGGDIAGGLGTAIDGIGDVLDRNNEPAKPGQ